MRALLDEPRAARARSDAGGHADGRAGIVGVEVKVGIARQAQALRHDNNDTPGNEENMYPKQDWTRFVLDLRRNGGGNGVYNRAIVRALLRSRFDAPEQLFVITGRRTFSAAQMLPTELETRSNPIIVGEP